VVAAEATTANVNGYTAAKMVAASGHVDMPSGGVALNKAVIDTIAALAGERQPTRLPS
jgi:hypothetical protein